MKMSVPKVFIVDDDASVRKSLVRVIESIGYRAEAFSSAEGFMTHDYQDGPSCLVLDVRMPGRSGIELQKELAARGVDVPIIFITGHGSIPMSVRAMKDGAVDFLPKPFDEKQLLAAIHQAIKRDVERRRQKVEKDEIGRLLHTHTPREHQVLRWVITGMLNKQVAYELGVTEKTIKVHRSRVMHKMKVESVAELVRLAQKVGITPPEK